MTKDRTKSYIRSQCYGFVSRYVNKNPHVTSMSRDYQYPRRPYVMYIIPVEVICDKESWIEIFVREDNTLYSLNVFCHLCYYDYVCIYVRVSVDNCRRMEKRKTHIPMSILLNTYSSVKWRIMSSIGSLFLEEHELVLWQWCGFFLLSIEELQWLTSVKYNFKVEEVLSKVSTKKERFSPS